MKVLFVIHHHVFGGPHNQALRLAGRLRDHGVDTVVLLPRGAGDAAARLRGAGLEVLETELHWLRATPNPRVQLAFALGFAPEVGAIRRIIKSHDISVVQVGGLVNPHAAIAAKLEGVPVVWQILDSRAPMLLGVASMVLVRLLADVVMPTGRRILSLYPAAPRLRRIVPFTPPVDTEAFRPRPELRPSIRAEWGIGVADPVVGAVANVNPMKGIPSLVRAFGIVRARVPAARLVLVGAEYTAHRGLSEEVRREASRLGLVEGRDILFLGPRDDVDRLLNGFDVLALASVPRSEGIPTAVLEAMASAVPVVATDVGGVGEVVRDGVDGRVVAPLDEHALAAALSELLDAPEARKRMGEAGRRHAEEMFAVDRCAETHLRAYRLALRGGAAPRRQGRLGRRADLLALYVRRIRVEGVANAARRIARDPRRIALHAARIIRADATGMSNRYESTGSRTADVRLVARALGVGDDTVAEAFAEIEADEPFLAELQERYRAFRPEWSGAFELGRFKILYALVRLGGARTVLETGVHDGLSTALMLRALERNGQGRLVSIDLPSTDLPPGAPGPGWLVPDRLKERWRLHLGDSRRLLPELAAQASPIDLFLHDSDHSRDHRDFEFRTVQTHMAPAGVMASDDDEPPDSLLDELAARWSLHHLRAESNGAGPAIGFLVHAAS